MTAFEFLLRLAGTLGLILAVPLLGRARAALRRTTLSAAWGWGAAGLGLWGIAWGITLGSEVAAGALDQLWYAVAVMMLCPLIAVLGARRPGSRVWTWFVLVPLLLVFAWPVLTVWMRGGALIDGLEIEEPVVLGYGLVLLMGFGNYFGTRYTLAALLLAAALVLLTLPLSPGLPVPVPPPAPARVWATLCLGAAFQSAAAAARSRPAAGSPLERVWFDFRDLYGIVWARRFMDRVNDTAAREEWAARLELHGFVWTSPGVDEASRARTRDRAEHAFRWLLRRFVDAEWIDARLGEAPAGTVTKKR